MTQLNNLGAIWPGPVEQPLGTIWPGPAEEPLPSKKGSVKILAIRQQLKPIFIFPIVSLWKLVLGIGQENHYRLSESHNRLIRPKIKFYLFAIAYLPPLLLPTQLFFLLFTFFFFSTVSIFQFQSEILNLYKLTRKPPTGIASIPHFLPLFLLWWLSYLFTFQYRRGYFIQSN